MRWKNKGGYSRKPHFKVFGDTFMAVKVRLISKKIYLITCNKRETTLYSGDITNR